MTNDTILQSKTIDLLRFPLAIAVIYIHSFGMPVDVDIQAINYSELTSLDIYNLLRVFFSHVVTTVAVPTFFLTAGFLFFNNIKEWNKQVYFKKIKIRLTSLILPYILWNIIALLVLISTATIKEYIFGTPSSMITSLEKNGLFSIFWDYSKWGEQRTNILGWHTPMTGPINFPLWFLRELIVVSILTPVIFYFLKYTKLVGLLILGIAYYTKIWPIAPGFRISAFFFFSIGAYLSMNKKNLVIEFRRIKFPCYLLAGFTAFYATYLYGSEYFKYIIPIYVITGTISILNIGAYLLENKKNQVNPILAKSSFFIYAIHTLLILGLVKQINAFFSSEDAVFFLLIRYLISPFLTVTICLGIYLLVQKFTPKLLALLMGNRQ